MAFHCKRLARLLLLAPLAATVGCKPPAPPPATPPLVAATRVGGADAASTFRVTGDIHARVESNLAFRVSGKVVARLVDVGAHVAAGAVVARLDSVQQRADIAVQEAAVASAAATLANATLELSRDRTLFAHAAIAKAALDTSEANGAYATSVVASARARLDIARDALTYDELRAGHAGTITARAIDVGQTVQPGVTVYSLAEDGPRDAVFRIDQSVANRIGPTTPITVALVDDPRIHADGLVREVAPAVELGSESVRIKVAIDKPPVELTLGSPVVGSLTLTTAKTMTIPAAAIVSDTTEAPAVWVIDPATHAVKLKRIEVASYESKSVVVRSGLAAGDLVVTDGSNHLRPSQVVQLAAGERP